LKIVARRTLIKAVYQYDLVQLPLEFVEMLPSFIPNDTEMKAIKVNDYRSNAIFDKNVIFV